MLAAYPSGTINKFQIPISCKAALRGFKIVAFGPLISCSVSPRSIVPWSNIECYQSSFSPKGQIRPQRRWMFCRSRNNSISPDDEYRSSRNIAISLLRRYRTVIERGGGETLKEFISAGVNAYALGCTDEDLRKELMAMKELGLEIERMESYGGSTQTKSKISLSEVDECILWLCIVFITILCTPQPTVVRWSSTPSVSDEILSKWRGFCAVIANAYYIRGMAWLPVKTLQLEQMAVTGQAEEPSKTIVAYFCNLHISAAISKTIRRLLRFISAFRPKTTEILLLLRLPIDICKISLLHLRFVVFFVSSPISGDLNHCKFKRISIKKPLTILQT